MSGNYVAINADTNAFDVLGIANDLPYAPHITLMYSPNTNLPHDELAQMVDNMSSIVLARTTLLHPTGVDMFENDDGGYSVVLLVDHSCLRYTHQLLKLRGLRHTYPEYQPHLSLTYNTHKAEAEELARLIELQLGKIVIQLTDVVAEPTA